MSKEHGHFYSKIKKKVFAVPAVDCTKQFLEEQEKGGKHAEHRV